MATELNVSPSQKLGHLLNAAKEVVQELALLGLSRQGFFNDAAFHGGTAFRILYGLDRFSEDLDFCLRKADEDFDIKKLLDPLIEELSSWGLDLEVVDKSAIKTNVKKVFIKENSLGAILKLDHPLHSGQKLRVKIELDINPSAGAKFENKLCHFPTDFYVVAHDLPTMFAGKLHALICRPYEKGRDWYDFVEYLRLGVNVNLDFLKNALNQVSPKDVLPIPKSLDVKWISSALEKKVKTVNFKKMIQDISPFVEDKEKINLWSESYFLEKVKLFSSSVKPNKI